MVWAPMTTIAPSALRAARYAHGSAELDRLRVSEGEDFRIPTTTVDEVLDEVNGIERSPWDPT